MLKSYMQFTKFRLSFLVIISALSGYLFVGGADPLVLLKLSFGGFLVTAASNGINQLLEIMQDSLMKRTQNRPLVTQTIKTKTGLFVSLICLILGSLLLFSINIPSFLLGIGAFVSYSFIYTPLKGKTPWAVFVGAFPGAIPPMLGAIAHTGTFGFIPGLLFFIQFMWQFPHFWAIAWVLDDDYKKAGFYLLPSRGGRDKGSAFQILIYTLCLMPVSLMPIVFNISGGVAATIIIICGIVFIAQAIKLFSKCDVKSAQELMFGSFIYLPLVQIALMIDKV